MYTLIQTLRLPSACRTVVQADIVFLVDESWSVGQNSFSSVKGFISAIISSFQDSVQGAEGVRFGVTVFGDVPRWSTPHTLLWFVIIKPGIFLIMYLKSKTQMKLFAHFLFSIRGIYFLVYSFYAHNVFTYVHWIAASSQNSALLYTWKSLELKWSGRANRVSCSIVSTWSSFLSNLFPRRMRIALTDYSTLEEVLRAIRDLPYDGGSRRLGDALKFLVDPVFSPAISRDHAPKVQPFIQWGVIMWQTHPGG